MNRQETELFEDLERHWVNYFSKFQFMGEIPFQGEGVQAKIEIYKGDIPQSSDFKPDMMPGIVDKYRKYRITHNEHFAARMMLKVPKNLQDFVMIEPLLRKQNLIKIEINTGSKKIIEWVKPTQTVIANTCKCSIDQYKKRRNTAKKLLVSHAMINAVHAKRSA